MRNLLLVLSVLFVFAAGCATPKTLVDLRQDKAGLFTAAGFTPELTERMEFDERNNIYYKFEHDKENLYLLFATSDNILQRKIIYFGLTVWTDRTGSQEKKQGFRFPTGTGMTQNLPGMNPPQSPVDFGLFLDRFDDIDLIGIYGTSVRKVKRRDSQIRPEIRMAGDYLVYHAVIPFGVLKHRYDPLLAGKPVSLGIETGHLELPSRRSGDFHGRSPGGMYPGTTGRGMYGPGQARMPDRNQADERGAVVNNLSRPTRFWIDLEFQP